MNVQNRSFLGAMAAAIKSICLMLINAVGVANDGIAMAEKAVRSARKRQVIDLGISMNNYATKAREDAVRQQVKAELDMREFINNNPERQALVTKARESIDAIIKAELAELSVKEE